MAYVTNERINEPGNSNGLPYLFLVNTTNSEPQVSRIPYKKNLATRHNRSIVRRPVIMKTDSQISAIWVASLKLILNFVSEVNKIFLINYHKTIWIREI